MGEIIVVTSGKGGVGKTTTTANLGSALARSGKKVLLLDGDVGLRNLDVALGLENSIVYDFVDIIEGRCRISQALVKDKKNEGLYMIAASQTREKGDIDCAQMIKLLNELSENFDFIFIDCPAGIEQGFKNAVAAAKSAIVVSTPDVASVRDADRVIAYLESEGIEKISLVVNKIRPKMVIQGNMLGVEDVIEILAVDLLGVVPDDEEIIICSNNGETLPEKKKSIAANAYANIAGRLSGMDIPITDIEDDGSIRYLLGKLFRKKKPGGYFRLTSTRNIQ